MTDVLIVDDHELFRAGLVQLIDRMHGFHVIAEAGSSASAVTIAEARQPDLVTLDVEVDDQSVVTTIRQMRRLSPRTHIVILTMHSDRVLERTVLSAGAAAFASKAESSADLQRVLQETSVGSSRPRETDATPALLSRREEEVLRLIKQARSNKEIANWMSIAEGTVKRHAGSIYEKLGVRSRGEAVAVAVRLGL